MKINFKNKKILITGGTRGIGKAIAQEYSKLKASVIVTGTSKEKPINMNSNIKYEQLLIKDTTNWQSRIIEIIDKYDGFDICINNAGINKINKINKTKYSDINDILLTNLNAPIYISKEVSKKMIDQRFGHIINIGSIFGVVTKEGRNPYTASKSGLIGVTKTIAVDLAKFNIMVNCISPGFVNTKLTRNILGEKGMKKMKSKIPLKKLAKVSDIVPSILFLTSNYNNYITGQNIIIDGGFTLE